MDDIKNTNNTTEEVKDEMAGRIYLTETELNTERVDVKPVVIRAFCPHCGREIKCTHPFMFNPFNFEKHCIYDCECGLHADLAHAYPRVVFVDKDNNEYDAYTK